VTVDPLAVQPAGVAETKVVPSASWSVTTAALAVDGPRLVWVIVHTAACPATTAAGAVFVVARSALEVTGGVVVVAVLSVVSGSATAPLTVAVLGMVTPSGVSAATVAVTTKVAFAPAASGPTAQVRSWPLAVQPGAETRVSRGSRASVTVAPGEPDGPLLCTVRVNVVVPPATAAAPAALPIARSALAGPTVVVTVAELFPGVGSGVVALTVVVLVSTVPEARPGPVATCKVTTTDPPAGTVPRSQATAGVQTAPVEETRDTPGGSVSASVTPSASDGPLLVMVSV
jgi:hypothetical protein